MNESSRTASLTQLASRPEMTPFFLSLTSAVLLSKTYLCSFLISWLAHWHPLQNCPLTVSMIVGPLIWTLNRQDKCSVAVRHCAEAGVGTSWGGGVNSFTAQNNILNACIHQPGAGVWAGCPITVLWDRPHLWRSTMRRHLLYGWTSLMASIWWTT